MKSFDSLLKAEDYDREQGRNIKRTDLGIYALLKDALTHRAVLAEMIAVWLQAFCSQLGGIGILERHEACRKIPMKEPEKHKPSLIGLEHVTVH